MRVHVLHLFCDGVLSETRVFATAYDARMARVEAMEQVGVGVVGGEVVDVNGATWSAAVESVAIESSRADRAGWAR